MKGFPRHINTKQDVLNLIDDYPEQTKSFLQSFSTPFRQLSDLAIILAIVVFPTPLMPVKRYALGNLFALIELKIVSAAIFCPNKSSNT